MHLTDSHAHLFSSPIGERVEAVLEHAQAAGVKTIVNICIDPESLQKSMGIRSTYPWVHHTAAVHPHDAKEGEAFFLLVQEQARKKQLVAIGETGLDYHYDHSPREIQKHFLKLHFELALECKLPVVIHCREAFEDLFSMIDRHYLQAPGVIHCFTGTLQEAEAALKRGFYLSFSGIITFKKSIELREIVRAVPLDKLLIETDAPFLAPQNHRGKPNEPAFLVETASAIASLKGLSLEQLAQVTTKNASALFQLKRT